MRHENSVFHELQQHVPWSVFDRLVDEHKADHRVRRLNTKSQFLALLFGQLSGAASLREIEAGLSSHRARLYHVGGRTIARTTLADANARRPAALFGALFAHMANSLQRDPQLESILASRKRDLGISGDLGSGGGLGRELALYHGLGRGLGLGL